MSCTRNVCYLLYIGVASFLLNWILEVSTLRGKSSFQESNLRQSAYGPSVDVGKEDTKGGHKTSVSERLIHLATNNTIILSICV